MSLRYRRVNARGVFLRIDYGSTRGGYSPPLKEARLVIRHGSGYRSDAERLALLDLFRAIHALEEAIAQD